MDGIMYIDEDEFDFESLRQDLVDHFTAAMFTVSPVAMMDLTRVENAGYEELIRIAVRNNFDLNKYINNNGFKR